MQQSLEQYVTGTGIDEQSIEQKRKGRNRPENLAKTTRW